VRGWIWGGMGANDAFLRRLFRIVEEAVPTAERAADARALVDAYRERLYAQHGISRSRRPTMQAKQRTKDALDDLRLKVLKAELEAPAGSASIFATARYRIEMTRRALDIRIVADEAVGVRSIASNRHAGRAVGLQAVRLDPQRQPGDSRAPLPAPSCRDVSEEHLVSTVMAWGIANLPDMHAASQDDRQLIEALRRRLRDARVLVKSYEAIRKSRNLLARFVTFD
jgi:hypothetical protein